MKISRRVTHQHLKMWSCIRVIQKIKLQFILWPQEKFAPYCAVSQDCNISHTSKKGFPISFSSSIIFPVQGVEQNEAFSWAASVQPPKWFQQLMRSLISWSCCLSVWVGMIGSKFLLILNGKASPYPYLFMYLQHISGLPATGKTITARWECWQMEWPQLFVERLLSSLERRWYCWHWLHLCKVQLAHIWYIMAFCRT